MFILVPALRKDEIGGHLGDIDSHMPSGHIYRDSDKVTWAHETIHGIHARMRMEFDIPNGYYFLGNEGYVLQKSPVTLKEIAQAIPKEYRGRHYQLYLIQQQRYWNENGFYLFDELVAYMSGAIVGRQLDIQDRYRGSFKSAKEFYIYCEIVVNLCHDKNWEHVESVDQLLWKIRGILNLIQPLPTSNQIEPSYGKEDLLPMRPL